MLELFIAKLSVYANCVPRSQSFYCRIKMSLLFNARNVSFGCCGFRRQWGSCALSEHGGECQPPREGSYGSGQGNSQARDVTAAPTARAAALAPCSPAPGIASVPCFCLPCLGGLGPSTTSLGKPGGSLRSAPAGASAVPSVLQTPARLPSASLPGSGSGGASRWLRALLCSGEDPSAGGWGSLGFLCLAHALIRDSGAGGGRH